MSGTFSGVGTLQFTPDNKHVYAYSGIVLVGTAKTKVIEFETNSFYLVGDLTIFLVSDTTDDIEFIVEFDNQTILETNTTHYNQYTPYQPLPIIIPPFTKVTLSGLNQGSGSKNVGINFTGEAKGTIEQFDLRLKNE